MAGNDGTTRSPLWTHPRTDSLYKAAVETSRRLLETNYVIKNLTTHLTCDLFS